jgi:predicted  nucleic acid-binding Zn-ribbon protein
MWAVRAGLAIAAAATLAGRAPAWADPSPQLNCPSTASAQRIDALEHQVGSLEDRLDSLDDRLDQLADQRRDTLDQTKDKVEAIVHDEGMSPEQRDREVARAISEAEARGQATAVQAQALHRSMDDLKGKIDMLRQEMRALAAHKPKTNDGAG